MTSVAVVDYGLCNVDSVRRALEECGVRAVRVRQPDELVGCSRVVLPGVGAFPDAMAILAERSLDEALTELVQGKQTPFLGICLGMQLLATCGREGVATRGLGWIEGEVVRLKPLDEDERVPHIGWNSVVPRADSSLFEGVDSGKDFYFVHSYHVQCAHAEDVLAETPYCHSFVSALQRGHIFGVQFHPEKSQQAGLQVLRNFLKS